MHSVSFSIMAILFFSLQHLAGPNTQSFSIPDGQLAVDQNVVHSAGVARDIREGGIDLELVYVEYVDIRIVALAPDTAVFCPDVLQGQPFHFV